MVGRQGVGGGGLAKEDALSLAVGGGAGGFSCLFMEMDCWLGEGAAEHKGMEARGDRELFLLTVVLLEYHV